jgi:hypothetical protein
MVISVQKAITMDESCQEKSMSTAYSSTQSGYKKRVSDCEASLCILWDFC